MRYLPTIANTVGQWKGNNSPADSSGNGNTLSAAAGSLNYAAFDSCVSGFRLDDGSGSHTVQSALVAPASAVLRLTGDFTLQFRIRPYKTIVQSIFVCLSAGGGSVLYDAFVNPGTTVDFADNGGNRAFVPAVPWTTYALGGLAGSSYCMAVRRRAASNVVEWFTDGVLIGSTTGNAQVSNGAEVLTIGGHSADAYGSKLSGIIGDIRLLTVARSNADLAADVVLAGGTCADAMKYRGVRVKIRGAS